MSSPAHGDRCRLSAGGARPGVRGVVAASLVAANLLCVSAGQQPVGTPEAMTVTVDGVGAVVANVGAARDEAVRDALRRAVEQALGVSVEGRTVMVDLQVVEDRVMGRAEGFVRSYEIVAEERVEDLYRVTVTATVDADLMVDDLEAFGAMLRLSLGNPRVLVLAASRDGRRDEPEAERVLVDHLVARQFLVVSADQLGALYSREAVDDPAELAALARTADADLVVLASVDTTLGGTTATARNRIVTQHASVTLQAVMARTGQVVASRTGAHTSASTASALARGQAVTAAVEAALPQFTLDTISVLNASAAGSGGTRTFRVLVERVGDFDTLLRIREALGAARGVEALQQRQFDGTSVTFDVQGSATTEEVAIHMTSLDGFDLAVTYLDDQRLHLSLGGR